MNIEFKSMVGVPVSIYQELTKVCFNGNPTCITESEYDRHAQSEKTVLTFQSVEELPINRNLAFIVSDVGGRHYIIGHFEDPFPTIKRTKNLGTPAEEKAGYTYEVTLIGRKAIVEVNL